MGFVPSRPKRSITAARSSAVSASNACGSARSSRSSRSGSWSSTSSQALTVSGYGQPSSVGNSGSVVRAIATSGCGMGPWLPRRAGPSTGAGHAARPRLRGRRLGERGADARRARPGGRPAPAPRPRPGAPGARARGWAHGIAAGAVGRPGLRPTRGATRPRPGRARRAGAAAPRRAVRARSPTRWARDPARGR